MEGAVSRRAAGLEGEAVTDKSELLDRAGETVHAGLTEQMAICRAKLTDQDAVLCMVMGFVASMHKAYGATLMAVAEGSGRDEYGKDALNMLLYAASIDALVTFLRHNPLWGTEHVHAQFDAAVAESRRRLDGSRAEAEAVLSGRTGNG